MRDALVRLWKSNAGCVGLSTQWLNIAPPAILNGFCCVESHLVNNVQIT